MPRLKWLAANVAVGIALLIAIEGVVSYALVARQYAREPDLDERRHTQHDPLLGWVNQRGVSRPDMYGPGVSLTTNAQGFRSDREFDRQVPSGRFRILCSGDSFTLGYGVDNNQAWCQQLETLDPRIEPVNMGQGGYGLGQAYLWYQRDGAVIAHQMHLVAFIVDDIARMTEADFNGYPKPLLVVEGGALTTKATPVPGPWSQRLRRVIEFAERLRTVEALRGLGRRAGLTSTPRHLRHANDDESRAVAAAVLAALKRLDRERSTELILIQLPVDFPDQRDPHGWSAFIEQQAQSLGIPMIQLANAFDGLPASEQAGLFIQAGQLEDPAAEGHYTAAGNARVARLVYERIKDRVVVVD